MKSSPIALLLAVVLALSQFAYAHHYAPPLAPDYRAEMQNFVIDISQYAKTKKAEFLIVPQNGLELLSSGEEANLPYIEAIDGFGQEPYMRGDGASDVPRSIEEIAQIRAGLKHLTDYSKKVLLTDYSTDEAFIRAEMRQPTVPSAAHFFGALALDAIPKGVQRDYIAFNDAAVTALSRVQNFLYLVNPQRYPDIVDLVDDIAETNYDLIIVDAFDNDGKPLSKTMVERLQRKKSGAKRLIIAYMSIGEAEDYRHYYSESPEKVDWLDCENPNWEGNYYVKYWRSAWQRIIFGDANSYLDKIIAMGFDGVYLDTIDTYLYYEDAEN